MVISERLAKLLFPNQDPISKHVLLWKGQVNRDAEVVGVVGDSRERGLAADPTLTVYLPYGRIALTSEFVVHTRGNPLALVPAVRSIIAKLDPNLPIADVRTFEEVVETSIAPQRFNAILLAVFSGLALLLATTGIYGVLSYSVSQRVREIGLRMALGADRRDVLRMIVGQGLRLAVAGILIGAGIALLLARLVSTFSQLLYGVRSNDPVTFITVSFVLVCVSVLACYLPARRASRVEPMAALKYE